MKKHSDKPLLHLYRESVAHWEQKICPHADSCAFCWDSQGCATKSEFTALPIPSCNCDNCRIDHAICDVDGLGGAHGNNYPTFEAKKSTMLHLLRAKVAELKENQNESD